MDLDRRRAPIPFKARSSERRCAINTVHDQPFLATKWANGGNNPFDTKKIRLPLTLCGPREYIYREGTMSQNSLYTALPSYDSASPVNDVCGTYHSTLCDSRTISTQEFVWCRKAVQAAQSCSPRGQLQRWPCESRPRRTDSMTSSHLLERIPLCH